MVETSYIARSKEEALTIRKEVDCEILAGGTDMMVQNKRGVEITPKFKKPVLFISSLEELKGIEVFADRIEIKALTVSSAIAACEAMPYFVKTAASLMGAISLRNSATIGGNIANASPKGDLPQPLTLLDSLIELESLSGKRTMLVDEFIIGAKKTALRSDEIISKIIVPIPKYTYGYYKKIGSRKANTISKLTFSALIDLDGDIIKDIRFSSGSAGPKVARSRENEEKYIGLSLSDLTDEKINEIALSHLALLSPRAMPKYRKNATARMLVHFLTEVRNKPNNSIIE